MNFTELIAICLIALLIIMTFISSPKESIAYGKAMVNSIVKLIRTIINTVNKFRVKDTKNISKE